MKKINTIFILGLLTAFFPFLGFPGLVKTYIVLIFGIAISAISGIMIIEHKVRNQSMKNDKEDREETFIDNKKDFFKKTLEKEQSTPSENFGVLKEQKKKELNTEETIENKEKIK